MLDREIQLNLAQLQLKIKEMDVDDRLCSQVLLKEWQATQPLLNKRILINCHLTIATLILIELFIFSGAEIKITCTDDLVCHEEIKDIFLNLDLYLSPEEVHQETYKHYFDVVSDCGAYLANTLEPKIGFIELTHVERSEYISTKRPVISVDKGFIKQIETTFGTGDGFVRAIKKIYLEMGINYKDKSYIIFGYGKVGQGISSCLMAKGVPQNQITIVEMNELRKNSASLDGYTSLSILENLETIRKIIPTIDCAVTATGQMNSISNFLNYEDFSQVEYLANMGTHDEWGSSFPKDAILYDKHPLNFMLDYPTQICYLDPIFAVLACATIDIIDLCTTNEFIVHKPSLFTERKVLNTWLLNNNVHPNMKEQWLNELENHV